MNKVELIRTVSDQTGITRRACRKVLQAALDVIKQTDRTELRGFGVFHLGIRPGHTWQTHWNDDGGVKPDKVTLRFKQSKINTKRRRVV